MEEKEKLARCQLKPDSVRGCRHPPLDRGRDGGGCGASRDWAEAVSPCRTPPGPAASPLRTGCLALALQLSPHV